MTRINANTLRLRYKHYMIYTLYTLCAMHHGAALQHSTFS